MRYYRWMKAGRRSALLVAGCLLTGIWLTGCGSGSGSAFPPSQSLIYVDDEGTLYTSLVEAYDPADTSYDVQELSQMAKQEAESYTGVTLSDCTLEDGMARVIYQYSDGEALVQFTKGTQDEANQVDSITATTVMEGLAARTDQDGVWTDARKGQEVDREKIMRQNKLHMVTIDGEATIQTEGAIRYYSGEVNLTDTNVAEVKGQAYLIYR